MKCNVIIFVCMLNFAYSIACNAHSFSDEGGFLQFSYALNKDKDKDNDATGNGSLPKNPPRFPTMSLTDYSLLIYEGCDDTTLRLIDESDNVAFTQYITTGTTQVVLPSTLSGTFELQIIRGQYLFYTEIEL